METWQPCGCYVGLRIRMSGIHSWLLSRLESHSVFWLKSRGRIILRPPRACQHSKINAQWVTVSPFEEKAVCYLTLCRCNWCLHHNVVYSTFSVRVEQCMSCEGPKNYKTLFPWEISVIHHYTSLVLTNFSFVAPLCGFIPECMYHTCIKKKDRHEVSYCFCSQLTRLSHWLCYRSIYRTELSSVMSFEYDVTCDSSSLLQGQSIILLTFKEASAINACHQGLWTLSQS